MCMYAIYHPSHVWIDPSLVTVFYVEALPKKEVLRFPAKPPGAGDYAGARPRCWKGLSSARPRLSCHIFPPEQSIPLRKECWAGLVGAEGKLAVLCCRGLFSRALVLFLPAPTAEVTYGNTPTFVYDQCGVPEPGPQDPRSWVACVVGNSSL